jgi:hypothetical protein
MSKKENIKAYYIKKYYDKKNEEDKKKFAINLQKRRFEDIKYQLWENVITRIKKSYENYKNIPYNINYKELIGCNEDEFFEYIQRNLNEEYTLENYPSWELDHIIGICNFNLMNIEDAKKCFNYKNVIPLSFKNNRTKKKYVSEANCAEST